MSHAKMTPGPWTWEVWPPRGGDKGRHRRLVVLAQGGYLCELEDCSSKPKHEEQEANARAIAALPELIEAARTAIPLLLRAASDRGLPVGDLRQMAVDMSDDLRRVLARIDGEGI